jgi:hypothetical protein
MKYTIEIIWQGNDGTRRVLRRFASKAGSPTLAKAKGEILLRRAPDANSVRIADHRGEEIYSSHKD